MASSAEVQLQQSPLGDNLINNGAVHAAENQELLMVEEAVGYADHVVGFTWPAQPTPNCAREATAAVAAAVAAAAAEATEMPRGAQPPPRPQRAAPAPPPPPKLPGPPGPLGPPQGPPRRRPLAPSRVPTQPSPPHRPPPAIPEGVPLLPPPRPPPPPPPPTLAIPKSAAIPLPPFLPRQQDQNQQPGSSNKEESNRRIVRKPAPGLIARLKLLDTRRRKRVASANVASQQDQRNIGRIPENQLRELEVRHRRQEEVVLPRRGRAWTGPSQAKKSLPEVDIAALGLHGAASASTTALQQFASMADSDDHSSIVSTSDALAPSDSEHGDALDRQKYRLPDLGKSRGSSRNGIKLEDGSVLERDKPPTPPPKDLGPLATPLAEDSWSSDSYFNPSGLSRAASIYTLSRASFTNQISQLTSIRLPEASSLSSSISSILNSVSAAKALNDAADQISIWIQKASEVLNGLDAEDDVDWAAAGGRDGLGDVDAAINRFESLIDIYVGAIENLESRPDIGSLSAHDLKAVVDRMERILRDWDQVKATLHGVKEQVEMAMEWEELWDSVLGEIGMEQENLNRLIFEMEERRHKNSILDVMGEPGQGLDIKELETIVEEAPIPKPGEKAEQPAQPATAQEDSNLLSLFARMQPLRASLDFLPMRLSVFVARARPIFPSACEELQNRLVVLEAKYKKLESDAESLRKELGEDRWVLIFRKAGRQALKMCESVERSVAKLRDGLDEGTQHTNEPGLIKRIENYEAKKEHYGPAIQQVLAIIDRGVKSRLTVNGEILRLQTEMQRRWTELGAMLKGMDFALEQMNIVKSNHHHQQLRDSISTILSEQRSVASSTGTLLDTPGSSPASSVVLVRSQGSDHGTSTPFSNASKSRQGSFASNSTLQPRLNMRYTSMPTSTPNQHTTTTTTTATTITSTGPRRTPLARASTVDLRSSVTGVSSRLYTPPQPPRSLSRNDVHDNGLRENRPRWNSSTSMKDTTVGHNFKALSATTPSPYRKQAPTLRSPRSFSTPQNLHSGAPMPSPLGRDQSHTVGGIPRAVSMLSPPPPETPQYRYGTTTTRGGGPPSAMSNRRMSGIGGGTHLPRPSSRSGVISPPPDSNRSALPRASSYGAFNATSNLASPTTPPSNHYASSGSTATLTNLTSQRKSSIPQNLALKTPITPEATPSEPSIVDDESPSSTRSAAPAKTRPGSAMAGSRRLSMLPQPKRLPSGVATAAAVAAMGGTPSGRNSRMGRGTSLGFRASGMGTDDKPRWR